MPTPSQSKPVRFKLPNKVSTIKLKKGIKALDSNLKELRITSLFPRRGQCQFQKLQDESLHNNLRINIYNLNGNGK